MTQDRQSAELRSRARSVMRAIQLKMLDLAEQQLDALEKPEPSRPPISVFRRQLSNMLGLWQFCHRSRCSRSKCCKGEPKECISTCLILLPHSLLAQVLSRKDIRSHLHHRKANDVSLT